MIINKTKYKLENITKIKHQKLEEGEYKGRWYKLKMPLICGIQSIVSALKHYFNVSF